MRIDETWGYRAIEIWQDKVFDLLLYAHKIDPETVAGMREWKHSGFSDKDLAAGNPRNFEVFKPLDFLANETQHIPDKGEHQIRYRGFYSNKKRGMRDKKEVFSKDVSQPDISQVNTSFIKKRKVTWAALIKCVYEIDPLKCPKCGGTMKIISFIERHQADVIEKVFTSVQKGKVFKPFGLIYCIVCLFCGPAQRDGLWKEEQPRPPPPEVIPKLNEPKLDYGFFVTTVPQCKVIVLCTC